MPFRIDFHRKPDKGSRYPSSSEPELAGPPRTTYEVPRPEYLVDDHRAQVAAAYERQGGNVSAIERDLRNRGVDFSRKRISKIMDELGLPRVRKGR
jgi:hypothetical protein